MQKLFLKKGDPKHTDKPSSFILVKKGDARTIKFKEIGSDGKIKMNLSSHQEMAFQVGPTIDGVDVLGKNAGSIEKVQRQESLHHDKEAFAQLCGPSAAGELIFKDGDIKTANGLALTVCGGAILGHLVCFTSHEGAHEFRPQQDGSISFCEFSLGYGEPVLETDFGRDAYERFKSYKDH